ncbi:DUF2513 domain-containing protein [Dyella sp. 2HG41-7]|uniref:DUF2513 domain-containing protein n=1 Tax=Dyella sp. 2HG41-7 TaxID=2883239 RepID=UPI001F35C2FF|nr:DUF2513 domain-containing protein [Dyella sp. 2HG41-7]
MKRDWDVVREILLALEQQNENSSRGISHIEGRDDSNVAYHIRIMIEAGLIEGNVRDYLGGEVSAVALRMTWTGHEFLDQIRSQNVWGKVKSQAAEKGLSLTFEVVKSLAGAVTKAILASHGLPT